MHDMMARFQNPRTHVSRHTFRIRLLVFSSVLHAYIMTNFWDNNWIIQGGPEKILSKTIDPFVVNSIFCEPPCIFLCFTHRGFLIRKK